MKSIIAKYLVPIVAVAAAGWTVPVFATSGQNSGSIRNTYVTSSTEFPNNPGDFLITITGLNTLCPGHSTAYTNQTDSNYLDIVGNANQLRGQGAYVLISWTTDASGYCHLTSLGLKP